MPLAKSLSAVRSDLQALLVEDLPTALSALRELLPDTSDKQGLVLALQAALKQLNKDRIRGVIDMEEYGRRLARLSADGIDLIDGLEEADFEPPAQTPKKDAAGAKQGSVLYRVPRRMPLRKPSICCIRVAVDEDAILEDLVLDDDVRLRERVEVSDVMSAELIDSEGGVFDIAGFNASRQKVRDSGYTQWLFRVTPNIEGEHQLLVKVSLLEFDRNTNEYVPRDISILETVTIVTEAPAPADEEPPFQSAGQSLTLGPQSNQSKQSKQSNKSLRAVALFLAFLMLSTSATWAFTPPPVRDFWVASLQDSAEAYAGYIEKHKESGPDNPRLEKAYFRRAEKTDSLSDLRAYQAVYKQQGQYRREVAEKIAAKELKAVESLEKQPDAAKIRRFLADYPDAARLSRVTKAVERLPEEQKTELLTQVEGAYVRSMQEAPSVEKLRQYRSDFREARRLDQMAEATAIQPEILRAAQPLIDSILEEKAQKAATLAEAQTVLKVLKTAGSAKVAERVEKIMENKSAPLRKQVLKDFQETKSQLQTQERAGARTPEQPNPAAAAEARDWQAACVANTIEAYTRFRNKYPKSAHLEELRAKVRAFKPGAAPETADWAEAVASDTPEAYIYFVGKYPRGQYSAEARQRIRAFSLSAVERKRLDAAAAKRLRAEQEEENKRKQEEADKLKQQEAAARSDRDADGIPDRADACPDEKGGAEHKGCPPPKPETPRNRKSGLEMVRVPGGTFTMGDDKNADDDNCEHPVSVKTFSFGKYEVTQADWREVTGENPSKFKGCDDCPVEQVSWDDVQGFLKKLNAKTGGNYRLPTEAEWEYAARGGSSLAQTNYNYAGSNDPDVVAWHYGNSGNKTHPVGTKKANALGIYDMSGNVWEWCQDTYGPYPCDKKTEKGSSRVLRGGSWDDDSNYCSVGSRIDYGPRNRNYDIGFRLAQDK